MSEKEIKKITQNTSDDKKKLLQVIEDTEKSDKEQFEDVKNQLVETQKQVEKVTEDLDNTQQELAITKQAFEEEKVIDEQRLQEEREKNEVEKQALKEEMSREENGEEKQSFLQKIFGGKSKEDIPEEFQLTIDKQISQDVEEAWNEILIDDEENVEDFTVNTSVSIYDETNRGEIPEEFNIQFHKDKANGYWEGSDGSRYEAKLSPVEITEKLQKQYQDAKISSINGKTKEEFGKEFAKQKSKEYEAQFHSTVEKASKMPKQMRYV